MSATTNPERNTMKPFETEFNNLRKWLYNAQANDAIHVTGVGAGYLYDPAKALREHGIPVAPWALAKAARMTTHRMRGGNIIPPNVRA